MIVLKTIVSIIALNANGLRIDIKDIGRYRYTCTGGIYKSK
jgi:hypothetical protein